PISWARRNASSTPAGKTEEVDRPTGIRRRGCWSLRGSPADSRLESFSRAVRWALLRRLQGLRAPLRGASADGRSRRGLTASPLAGQAWSVCNRAPHRLVGMHVRDLTAEDFVGYRTMSSGAFGGGSDPTSPDAPRDFSPGQTAL